MKGVATVATAQSEVMIAKEPATPRYSSTKPLRSEKTMDTAQRKEFCIVGSSESTSGCSFIFRRVSPSIATSFHTTPLRPTDISSAAITFENISPALRAAAATSA